MVRGLNKDPAEVKEVDEALKRHFAVTPLDCLIVNEVPIMNGLPWIIKESFNRHISLFVLSKQLCPQVSQIRVSCLACWKHIIRIL